MDIALTPDIDAYRGWVSLAFQTFFYGWPARILAVGSLVLAFWRGIYHQQFVLSALLYALTLMFTYMGTIARLFSGA